MAHATIRTATNLWIEAGEMSGGPRHQIEFSNQLADFFDDRARDEGIVWMRLAGGHLFPRPLAYRGTDYGQWTEIWRLGLLTQRMGGPIYAGRVVRFERMSENGETIYELSVADRTSAEVASWKRRSTVVDTTGGGQGREYGFW
jgi:hypothetical protein